MISALGPTITSTLYQRFAEKLDTLGFKGDIELGFAERTVLATDNSIYQILPEGVLYPTSTNDISLLLSLASQPEFHTAVFSARGGGTGTNGQSLTHGFMVDTSRYMNQVLEINAEQCWARVQAGAVKDDLNDQAAKHGLFFAPELSTSNRATVGGMVNTDASGQGSVVYGKTRHHVLELTSVLADGTVWQSSPLEDEVLAQLCLQENFVGDIHRTVSTVQKEKQDQVEAIFPKLNRNLTGYDLANIRNNQGQFDLNAILCGSEGTLAMISEIKVNLLPIPKHSALVLVFYQSFQESLQDAQALMTAQPGSIETIDSKVLNLAKASPVWESVKPFFPEESNPFYGVEAGINFVEFTGATEKEVQAGINRLTTVLEQPTPLSRLGFKVAAGSTAVKKIWNMRKLAVGLLGNMDGDARPIPFVEDVAVPPENLADFILAFRQLLDSHQLRYGMFGHVDAGVLHVRPAIDMKDPKQEVLVRSISDRVAALAKKYGGVLWGEHGKGIRSEYAPAFFAELYPALQIIKAVFDPHNQLNPGKIATPATSNAHPNNTPELLKIDGVPTRGQHDRTIEKQAFDRFISGMHCNGNGACFNYNPNSAMCPTWKATQDRIQSPKGRSGLVREWLKLQSGTGFDISRETRAIRENNTDITSIGRHIRHNAQKIKNSWQQWRGEKDFNHEVYQALDSCMSCKSCAGQCPIQVNVPDLRSRYFELYHNRYLRPFKHYLAATLEPLLPILANSRWFYNQFSQSSLGNTLSARMTGLQDLPAITSGDPLQDSCKAGATIANPKVLNALPAPEQAKTVILVQDAFTSYFETSLLTDLVELLIRLGYRPFVAPFKPNGKVLHVYGFLGKFEKIATANSLHLNQLAKSGISLVGLDAAITLTYRDEYREVMRDNAPNVQLLSEWFASQLGSIRQLALNLKGSYTLLAHCTEATNAPAAIGHWQALYQACGLTLNYYPTGCCGMSGIYGHESRNQQVSKKLYDLSWKAAIDNPDNAHTLVASGFSCRCQVKRLGDTKVPHPIQILLKKIQAG